ncbi:MAG: DNA repair protein [Sphingobacteriales bacterium]|nr:MAG: DNA repair protein [Sphingobacteriales bacterium]
MKPRTTSNPKLTLVAEIRLQYHPKVPLSKCPSVKNSEDAVKIFRQNWNADTLQLLEEFKVMFLNRNGKVLGIVTISQGGYNSTVVDPRMIFVAALKTAASSIILAHNHPSGNLHPSRHDRELTEKILQAGKLLDIEVIDHLIINVESYYSFADENKL